jgi:hypothetical protein
MKNYLLAAAQAGKASTHGTLSSPLLSSPLLSEQESKSKSVARASRTRYLNPSPYL